jgi:transposase
LPEVQNEAIVDEISVRKGQSYITVVVDHDSGRLVWAHPDRDGTTVRKFLDLLGKERCAQIELVSCDMATWITGPIAERCPGATVCLDPFHVVKLATDALDEIRRDLKPGPQGQQQAARQGPQGRPLRAVEAHRPPAAQARLDPEVQGSPATRHERC